MADTTDAATTIKKDKLRVTILTDAGRQIFLAAGNGAGKLVYTRATLSSSKPVDSQGNALDNETIRAITALADDLKEGQLKIDPPQNDHFTVIADFNNKNQPDDINFSSIGWFARIDTEDGKGGWAQGKEALIAITYTTKDHEVLAAGSPDHLSTEVISAALDMTISDAANIDMTVNEIGYVTRAELNAWQTKVEGDITKSFDHYQKNLTFTLDGKTQTKPDANGVITLPTYDKATIDQMVAGAGKGAGINTVQGVAPDASGNVNLTSVFYLRTDVDSLLQAQTAKINELTSSNTSKDNQITSLNNQITGLNNQINDLLNRVKYLEENAVIGKRFSNETDGMNWEKQADNRIAFVEGN